MNPALKAPQDIAQIFQSLPKDALEINLPYALFTGARVWLFFIASVALTYYSPWYLLPLAWIFQGTCMTGMFVVGHDCAHQSFSRSKVLNEVIGTISMMPLAFPYNGWELTHNHHHAFSNHMSKDELWRPLRKEDVEKMPQWKKTFLYYFYGPLFFQSSIFHHAYHFILPVVTSRNRIGTSRSIGFAFAGAILTILIASKLGSVVSIWLIPFLIFQFWLSTFTYFHHRNPRAAGWKDGDDWTKLYGSFFATVHVDYPAWVEFLTLDINWHVPHHISPLIPWYNLRKCTYALMKEYGHMIQTEEFGWKLWKETTTSCHVYDPKLGYSPLFEIPDFTEKNK